MRFKEYLRVKLDALETVYNVRINTAYITSYDYNRDRVRVVLQNNFNECNLIMEIRLNNIQNVEYVVRTFKDYLDQH